ncbi:MAG: response regulator [Nitrospirae bacterium]|nr:response regulator [Nitrospirota bacterium]
MAEKLLVVDDEQDIVKVLAKILELSGYEVHTATSGLDALRVVKEQDPDLVLLDYMMPDLTGLDVLRGIKTYSEDIYVVMVTGRGSEEVAATVMKAGASDYVIKPFEKKQILTVVKDTLRIRSAEITTRRLQKELADLNRDLEDKVAERTRDLVDTQERLIHQHNLASLGEMSGGMAHEIRNPLNSISLYAQIMIDELPPDDPKVDYVQRILSDVDRINAIVTNLNLFSRRIKRDKQPLHLQTPLETVLRTMSMQLVNKGVRVSVDIEGGLPEVLASGEEMEEVFSHLFVNSMHAMPEGGELAVVMRLLGGARNGEPQPGRDERPGQYIEVSVRDTGMGIPRDNIDKVFIPFFTTKTDWQGTGLGLSVANRVISDHKGTIDVESEEGHGTVFTIRLPVLESGAKLDAA